MSQRKGQTEERSDLTFVTHRIIFEAAPDGLLIVDEEGVIREANEQALRLFGYERGELRGRLIEDLVPPEARGRHQVQRAEYVHRPRRRPMGIGMELRGYRKDGRQVPVEISLSPCTTPEGRFIIAAVRDVSERRRLRQLGAGTLRAAEEERRRIARELHDDTAQCLAAVLVRLRILGRTDDPEARSRLLAEMQKELGEAVEGVRRISRGLRPPALEDVGVAAAIRSHMRGVAEHAGLDVSLELEVPQGLLEPEAELAVYRVVQEAVTNVLRHAAAEHLSISMDREGDEAVLRVVDDGRGFDPEAVFMEGNGLGLLGMDERARLIGGRLLVRSRPGRGTEVELHIPLTEEGADA